VPFELTTHVDFIEGIGAREARKSSGAKTPKRNYNPAARRREANKHHAGMRDAAAEEDGMEEMVGKKGGPWYPGV